MSDNGATGHEEYKLRCTLLGHASDVRAISVTSTGNLLTASRDKTARLWKPEAGSSIFSSETEYSGHTGYVTSVTSLAPSNCWSEGLTITGSRDATILVYLPGMTTPLKQLTGHTDTVSCLSCKDGVLVSGSWDHTARVWCTTDSSSMTFPCLAELKSHNGPIWAVELLDKEQGILTAAADKTILLWQQHKVVLKFVGHTDCVRALAVLSSSYSFLSASNDASIRRWDLRTGLCTGVYYGHTNFVYTLSPILNGEGGCVGFVSGSEDRTAKVWNSEGDCVQTLNLPCQSAWSVTALPNTDVAVGTSDGACRVYSTSAARSASAEEQTALLEEVAAAARPAAAELGDIQPDKLPDTSALAKPGTKDGKTQMVREAGKVMCYSWSAGKKQWEAVGEVVGGTGGSNSSSGKVLYQGKEYDYVFNVEVDEAGNLKLPYNGNEDPYMAAQRFIELHQLPQDQLDQVANFIITNSKKAPAAAQSQGYFDPFTGDTRYVPGASTNGSGSHGGGQDPFTSSEGYVPSYGGEKTAAVQSSHYPQTTSLLFEACNVQGITNKFKENNQLVDDKVKLTDDESDELLRGIFDDIDNIRAESVGPLEKALQWCPEKVWPSLDLLRLCLRSRAVQQLWVTGNKGAGIVNLLTTLLKPPSTTASQLLALRCLVNLSAHEEGCKQLTVTADSLLATVTDMAPYPNKNMEIAAATLLLNSTVLLTRNNKELAQLCQVLSGLCTLLVSCNDPEAQYRTLVGVGTVLTNSSDDCRQFAVSLDIQPLLETLTNSSTSKVKECSLQLITLLKTR